MDCVDHSAKASGVICYRNKMKIHLTIAIGFIVRHAGRSARCGTCCSEAAVSSFLHTRTPHHHQSSLRTPFLIMRDKIEALVRFPLEDLEGLDLSPFVPAGSGAVYSRRTDDWPPLAQLRRPHGHPCGRQHMYAAVRLIFSSTGAVAVASCAATRSNRMNEKSKKARKRQQEEQPQPHDTHSKPSRGQVLHGMRSDSAAARRRGVQGALWGRARAPTRVRRRGPQMAKGTNCIHRREPPRVCSDSLAVCCLCVRVCLSVCLSVCVCVCVCGGLCR